MGSARRRTPGKAKMRNRRVGGKALCRSSRLQIADDAYQPHSSIG
jgi:hypothetical protein